MFCCDDARMSMEGKNGIRTMPFAENRGWRRCRFVCNHLVGGLIRAMYCEFHPHRTINRNALSTTQFIRSVAHEHLVLFATFENHIRQDIEEQKQVRNSKFDMRRQSAKQ